MKTGSTRNYHAHSFVYGCFNSLIEDGLVIDHIDSNERNNTLNNLEAITHSQNCTRENNGNNTKHAKPVESVNQETDEAERG